MKISFVIKYSTDFGKHFPISVGDDDPSILFWRETFLLRNINIARTLEQCLSRIRMTIIAYELYK